MQSNSFEGGSAALENGTDLLLASAAPTLTGTGGLKSNTFAGTNFYINNGTASDIVTANTFDTAGSVETNNYRIEDRVFHKVDDTSKGLVTWVAGNTFVTNPAAANPDSSASTDSSISVASTRRRQRHPQHRRWHLHRKRHHLQSDQYRWRRDGPGFGDMARHERQRHRHDPLDDRD